MNKHQLSTELILANWPSDLDGHLHYCVGLSGGIDSVVLLHLLYQIRKQKPFRLTAVHVNHGISPNADYWQDFCHSLCQKLEIDIIISNLSVTKIPGQGLENSARIARYNQYQQTKADVIVLAHHQDDQIETLLSQLFRGSDIHNLAAMHLLSQKSSQYYWRPLLNFSKQQLIDYAKYQQLTNITDESNQDSRYLRNFIRNQIVPELTSFDPHIANKLVNSLITIQEAAQLNDELAMEDLKVCSMDKKTILVTEIAKLSSLRQINLLTFYLRYNNLPLPSHKQIKEFIHQTLNARPDRHPQLKLGNHHHYLVRKGLQIVIKELP